MWRWDRRAEAERASREVVAAREQERAADARLQASRQLAAQSRTVTARLRHEIDKNGWTEMLQEAWAGRGTRET